MFIPTWAHTSLTSDFPLCHCTGNGLMEWHSLHFLTIVLTAALDTAGSIRLAKYRVLLMAGCSVWQCTDLILSELHLLTDTAQIWGLRNMNTVQPLNDIHCEEQVESKQSVLHNQNIYTNSVNIVYMGYHAYDSLTSENLSFSMFTTCFFSMDNNWICL